MMPPLITGSPRIIDQTFPRSTDELNLVKDALAELVELVDSDRVHVVLTEAMVDSIGCFEWNARGRQYAVLLEIHTILSKWATQPTTRVCLARTDDVIDAPPHPLPPACQNTPYAQRWAVDAGKLLVKHDSESRGAFFIGIACEKGMTTGKVLRWNSDHRCFPLVGKESIDDLEDAYMWEPVPDNINNIPVTVESAIRNIGLLGGRVEKAKGGSHQRVVFQGARPWTISRNVDPIPDRFLAELRTITGLPMAVIRTAIVMGVLPQRTRRRI